MSRPTPATTTLPPLCARTASPTPSIPVKPSADSQSSQPVTQTARGSAAPLASSGRRALKSARGPAFLKPECPRPLSSRITRRASLQASQHCISAALRRHAWSRLRPASACARKAKERAKSERASERATDPLLQPSVPLSRTCVAQLLWGSEAPGLRRTHQELATRAPRPRARAPQTAGRGIPGGEAERGGGGGRAMTALAYFRWPRVEVGRRKWHGSGWAGREG